MSPRVADALAPLGWTPKPFNPDRHDEAHVGSRPGGPPRGAAEQPAWERQAHEEAERNRH